VTNDDLALAIKDRYGVKADELADIIRWASGLSDHDRGEMWMRFKQTWQLASPPRQAHFYKIAEELGIKRGGTYGKKYERECDNVVREPDVLCKTRYPLETMRCPKCGATTHLSYVTPTRGDYERH